MADDRITLLLDTNVFIAAYWARSSASARLIQACIDGAAVAHYTRATKREVERMLGKIRVSQAYIQYLVDFWAVAVEVEPAECAVEVKDPEDRKFLEAALGGSTDLLVTNDDHLLTIGHIGRTEILAPRSAARMLEA